MFPAKVIDKAQEHALECYPEESCGVVINDDYFACKNVHPEPLNNFRINPRTMAAAERRGVIQGVIHSHPDGQYFPSKADMIGQKETNVPWGIVVSSKDSVSIPFWWGNGVPRAPLIGRDFIHGIQDCFALGRDYYYEKLMIDVPDFPREDNWWTLGENMYTDHFEAAGFVRVPATGLQVHDIILMKIRSDVPNHCAIYLGGDKILHHLAMRQSYEEEMGLQKWGRQIAGYLRHSSLMKGPANGTS